MAKGHAFVPLALLFLFHPVAPHVDSSDLVDGFHPNEDGRVVPSLVGPHSSQSAEKSECEERAAVRQGRDVQHIGRSIQRGDSGPGAEGVRPARTQAPPFGGGENAVDSVLEDVQCVFDRQGGRAGGSRPLLDGDGAALDL